MLLHMDLIERNNYIFKLVCKSISQFHNSHVKALAKNVHLNPV